MVWLNKTNINSMGSDGSVLVLDRTGLVPKDQETSGTVNFGGGSLIGWGCKAP